MTACKPLDNGALLKVPDDHGAIFGPRSHVPVAVTNRDVDDDVHVAMERSLEYQRVLAPHFDDSIFKITIGKFISEIG